MEELLNAIQGSQAACCLGWILFHALWTGMGIAGLLAAALFLLRRRSANARYLAACAALAMVVASPAAVSVLVSPPGTELQAGEAVGGGGGACTTVEAAPGRGGKAPCRGDMDGVDRAGGSVATALPSPGAQRPPAWSAAKDRAPQNSKVSMLKRASRAMESVLPWAVLAWAGGLCALSVKQVCGWRAAQRLKRVATQPADRRLMEIAARLAPAIGVGKPVRLLRSAAVRTPTVIGGLRPAILLPAGLATGLGRRQAEAILAHELAHVRRRDYLVGLLQSLIETMLFYHPAVWFISGRVRAERENCCDDVAAALGGGRFSYAESLVRLAERLLAAGRAPRPVATGAPAAADGRKPSHLYCRIARLIDADKGGTG